MSPMKSVVLSLVPLDLEGQVNSGLRVLLSLEASKLVYKNIHQSNEQ